MSSATRTARAPLLLVPPSPNALWLPSPLWRTPRCTRLENCVNSAAHTEGSRSRRGTRRACEGINDHNTAGANEFQRRRWPQACTRATVPRRLCTRGCAAQPPSLAHLCCSLIFLVFVQFCCSLPSFPLSAMLSVSLCFSMEMSAFFAAVGLFSSWWIYSRTSNGQLASGVFFFFTMEFLQVRNTSSRRRWNERAELSSAPQQSSFGLTIACVCVVSLVSSSGDPILFHRPEHRFSHLRDYD